ncbi:MAG: hypothetical protein ACOX5Z_07275 [Desulfobulbus sp.]|jgi:hypothetical protein
MNNLDAILALEIKKELADSYFGFRKMIEEDGQYYNEQIIEALRQLESKVGFDLVRLYILLGTEEAAREFARITGLRDSYFLDPHLLRSPTIRSRLFKNQSSHGFTQRGRFHNLFFTIYNRLQEELAQYRAELDRLAGERRDIAEEIEVFRRKHDLGSMMGLMRRIDGDAQPGHIAGGATPLGSGGELEDKMRLEPPPEAHNLLPDISDLPPLKTCKSALTRLLDKVYAAQGEPDVRTYGQLKTG